MPQEILRAQLHLLLAKLAFVAAEGQTNEVLTDPTWTVRATIEPTSARADPVNPASQLSEAERCALEAATATPVPVKKLAGLAGYAPGAYFRSVVTQLVRRGLLKRTADGVCLQTAIAAPRQA